MKYIFIDTNIFLHFQDFKRIPWNIVAGVKECTLIIAPVVIDELDEKKIGTSRLGNKARKVLKTIETLIDNGVIEEDIFFEVILKKPIKKLYEENELNFKEQDHRLIASIIDFREERQVKDVVICTNDVGPRIRAKQYDINSLKLSEKYLLPMQESEIEKKMKKLEQENAKLKNRNPKIDLSFGNSKKFIEFKTENFKLNNYEDFKTECLEELKREFPYMKHKNPYENPLAGSMLMTPDSSQVNSYNKKLDRYFKEVEEVLTQIYESDKRKNLTFEIKLQINNSGTTPAEDVDIHLHFPDGFKLFESAELGEEIKLPEPPQISKMGGGFGNNNMLWSSILSPKVNLGPNSNPNRPSIKKTHSYNVDFKRDQIKHGYSEDLENLSIVFDCYDDITSFKLDYVISAGNLPNKNVGTLNVKFVKE